MLDELAVLGGELRDQLCRSPEVVFRAQRGLVALVAREQMGFGGAQRRVSLIGMATAQFGVGG